MNIPLSFGLANESDHPHQGHLDFAAISVTATSGTLSMRGIFPNPDGKIMPGLFARVRAPILGYEKAALLIPEVAIGYDQLGAYVLVVRDDNVVDRRSVQLGIRSEDRRVIRQGLTGEQWVIVQGQVRAIPGRKVNPVRQPPPAGAGRPGCASRRARPGKAPNDLPVLYRAAHLCQCHRLFTIILGLVCFYILPVSQYPPIVPPTIQVTTRYPGASAEVVAADRGYSHRTGGQRSGGRHLHVLHQRQRRQLHPDRHF